MPCSRVFSFAALNDSSLENEIGASHHCVPNEVKASVFIVSLLLHSMTFAAAMTLLVRGLLKKSAWKMRMITYASIVCASLGEILVTILLMASVTHPARYLLYFIWCGAIYSMGCSIMYFWVTSIADINWAHHSQTKRRMKAARNIGSVVAVVGFFLLLTVLPMAYSDNPVTLNWLYSFATFFSGFCCSTLSAGVIWASVKLRENCKPQADLGDGSPTLSNVARKLTYIRNICTAALLVGLAELLFPLYMGLTLTTTDPGLGGHFYYEYIAFPTVKISVEATALWLVQRAHSDIASRKSSSQDTPPPPPASPKFPSFTVEELSLAETK